MATKRSAYDFYPTPATAIQSFLEADKDNWINNELYTVLEPCAGDGNIINELRKKYNNICIVGNEIDSSHDNQLNKSGANLIFHEDFLQERLLSYVQFDVIMTNPPFSLAQEFITKCLEDYKPRRTIMLLRLNFLASQKRKEFWQKYPPSRIYVLSKRPSFTGNGTDSQDYAWFVWDNQKYEQQILVI